MELLVAMTIFALVMSSLFFSLRTSMRAYDTGMKQGEGAQSTRFVVGQVASDLRNVFYKTPAAYNIVRRQREAVIAERERQALRSGSSRSDIAQDETMPELGPKIDLAFRSTDGGEADTLSFVRLQGEKVGRDRQPWGLARVHYYVADNALWRAVEDVTAPETDADGNEIPKPVAPRIDKLANNVKGFDLKFGYFGEGETDPEWQMAQDWDSDASTYRNPMDEEDLSEDSAAPERVAAGATAPAQPGQPALPGQQQPNQPDDLPAWVEVTFTFADPRDEEKETLYKQIVQIPASQETYVPPDPSQENTRGRGSRRMARGGGQR